MKEEESFYRSIMGERDWEKDRINDVLENRRVPEDPVIIFFLFSFFF